MEPFCLNANPYDNGKQRSQIPGITVWVIYGDVQAFELGAQGLLRVGSPWTRRTCFGLLRMRLMKLTRFCWSAWAEEPEMLWMRARMS